MDAYGTYDATLDPLAEEILMLPDIDFNEMMRDYPMPSCPESITIPYDASAALADIMEVDHEELVVAKEPGLDSFFFIPEHPSPVPDAQVSSPSSEETSPLLALQHSSINDRKFEPLLLESSPCHTVREKEITAIHPQQKRCIIQIRSLRSSRDSKTSSKERIRSFCLAEKSSSDVEVDEGHESQESDESDKNDEEPPTRRGRQGGKHVPSNDNAVRRSTRVRRTQYNFDDDEDWIEKAPHKTSNHSTSTARECDEKDCHVCARGLPVCLQTAFPSWAAILRVVFWGLKKTYPNKRFFNLKQLVYDYVEVHWKRLCIGKTKSPNWRKQLQDTLAHNKKLFQNGSHVHHQKGWWTLQPHADPWKNDRDHEQEVRTPKRRRTSRED